VGSADGGNQWFGRGHLCSLLRRFSDPELSACWLIRWSYKTEGMAPDYPKPPFPAQKQPMPGSRDAKQPHPDHGETTISNISPWTSSDLTAPGCCMYDHSKH
jgi:hypothetical protein